VSDRIAHLDDDQLLDLALGLAADRHVGALAHLDACADCAQRFRTVSGSVERARAAAAERVAGAGVAARRARAGGVPAWALAAASVLVVGAWFVAVRPGRDAGYAIAPLPAPERSSATRGPAGAAADPALQAGLDAYARGDAAAAARLLASARVGPELEPVRRVYLANALLRTNHADAALDAFAGLDWVRLPEPWRSESRWGLAVALARSGHAASAESLRRVLAAEPGDVGERARRTPAR